MKYKLSEYSRHYRDLSEEAVEANATSLDNDFEEMRTRLDLEIIEKYATGSDYLDFPIGTGRIYPHMMNRFDVYGFDIAEKYIARAQEQFPDTAGNFHVNTLEDPSFERKFDTITCLRCLDNVEDQVLAVTNLMGLLNPGGRLIVNFDLHDTDFGPLYKAIEQTSCRIVAEINYDWLARQKNISKFRAYARMACIRLIDRKIWIDPVWRVFDRSLPQPLFKMLIIEKQ